MTNDEGEEAKIFMFFGVDGCFVAGGAVVAEHAKLSGCFRVGE